MSRFRQRAPRSVAGTALAILGLVAGAGLLSACSSDDDGDADSRVSEVPEDVQQIFDAEPYGAARWGYRVEDLDSGDVEFAALNDQQFVTGSTAKLFTIGSVYETLGPDTTLTTPVYGVGERSDGTLDGDLVLVASGDLALGGRGAINGQFRFNTTDSVYADQVPGTTETAPGDPLAGLRALSRQVEEAGINEVDGDVVIDDRLWEPFVAQGGTVTPIFVNDNVVDITIRPTTPGEPADFEIAPDLGLYDITVDVETVAGAGDGEFKGQENLTVTPDPDDPNAAEVSGTIEAGAPQAVRTFVVPDPATYARALFVRELERAGVRVTAPPEATNDEASLPSPDGYEEADEVASLESPELSEFGTMILSTSYNDGANAMLCLLAVELDSDTCTDGLQTVSKLVDEAGIPADDVVLIDGQGGDPDSVTPAAMVGWLRWTTEQDWGEVLENGLPVLGTKGDLTDFLPDSPAKGKVAAKPGTSAHPLPDGGLFVLTQAFAGFLETDDGKKLFSVYMSGGKYPEVNSGLFRTFEDLLKVSAGFQQASG